VSGPGKRKRKRKGHKGYWAQSRSGQLDLAEETAARLDGLAKVTAHRPAWPAAWGKAGSGEKGPAWAWLGWAERVAAAHLFFSFSNLL